jgi:hypothetical protein
VPLQNHCTRHAYMLELISVVSTVKLCLDNKNTKVRTVCCSSCGSSSSIGWRIRLIIVLNRKFQFFQHQILHEIQFASCSCVGCHNKKIVGPCVGIDAGDQLMMSRYILQRVCEDFQVYCTLHPKPIVEGDWNGAGMHTNVSTKSMREEGGLEIIKQAIYKLGAKHAEHIEIYGEGNELRLTGKFETASMDSFSYGIANRGASVRIGRDTLDEGMGYFEDRRPSSNADPYLVTGKIMSTIMGPEAPEIKPLNKESS